MTNTLAPEAAQASPEVPVTDAPVLSPEDAAATQAAEAALAAAPDASPLDRKGSAADRIAEVIAERNATREYAEYWRQQATAHIKPEPVAETPKVAPKLTDFALPDGSYDAVKWADAHAAWTDQQIEARTSAAVEQRLTAAQQKQQQTKVQDTWAEKCAEFRATRPDFDVVTSNPTLPVDQVMSDIIMASDKGPALFMHLGLNPAEAARIHRMPPLQKAAALGRLEEKLSAAPAPKRPQISAAPNPPSAMRGGGGGEVNLATCSLDDYLAARLKKR